MLIDSGKVIYTLSQEPPVITTREELKKNEARKEFKNLVTPRLEKNLGRLDKKRELELIILNR